MGTATATPPATLTMDQYRILTAAGEGRVVSKLVRGVPKPHRRDAERDFTTRADKHVFPLVESGLIVLTSADVYRPTEAGTAAVAAYAVGLQAVTRQGAVTTRYITT